MVSQTLHSDSLRKPVLVHVAWEEALRKWRVRRLARRVCAAQKAGDGGALAAVTEDFRKVSSAMRKAQRARDEKERAKAEQQQQALPQRTNFEFEREGAAGGKDLKFSWKDLDAVPEESFVPPELAKAGDGAMQLPPPGVAAKQAQVAMRDAAAAAGGKGKGKGKKGPPPKSLEAELAGQKRKRAVAEADDAKEEQDEDKTLVTKDWGAYTQDLKRMRQSVDEQIRAAKEAASQAERARLKVADVFDSDDDSSSSA
eukprot:TRINITY_DN24852_c0_g1_i1.p1 TRINITY_DN24852_c0_g1~~TRINITY_DN24852_c0_g1_i1.p1  ORF type:complete len:256 (+),score=131.99 TRINITY_DN24852_c0_g1_i1:119-886(+)